MKRLIYFVFFICICIQIQPVFSEIQMTEISCDVIRRVTFSNKMRESYDSWGFYIYDEGQKLYYAPSGKTIEYTNKVFDENQISYYGVPFIDDMVGDIHINRQSGTINMQFKSKKEPAVVTYNGRCSKVDNSQRF